MGGVTGTDNPIGSAIQFIGAELGTAFENAKKMMQEAARNKDRSVSAFTIYVQEDIGIGKLLHDEVNPKSTLPAQFTGVFVPSSVKSGDTVNVILYMHGDKVRIWDKTGTIRDYWNLPQLPLRQGLNQSGQPFILVAPTLGQKVGRDADFGNLGTMIDDHLDHIMQQLQIMGQPEFSTPKPPAIGQLIIAGHSGAYGPMRSILKSISKYKDNIKEIWCFDTMYGDTGTFMANHVPEKIPIYVYYAIGGSTEDHSHDLAKLRKPNIFVMAGVDINTVQGKEQRRPVEHDLLMQRFWLDRCLRMGTNGTNLDDQKRMDPVAPPPPPKAAHPAHHRSK
jgi:hypothetical protein